MSTLGVGACGLGASDPLAAARSLAPRSTFGGMTNNEARILQSNFLGWTRIRRRLYGKRLGANFDARGLSQDPPSAFRRGDRRRCQTHPQTRGAGRGLPPSGLRGIRYRRDVALLVPDGALPQGARHRLADFSTADANPPLYLLLFCIGH